MLIFVVYALLGLSIAVHLVSLFISVNDSCRVTRKQSSSALGTFSTSNTSTMKQTTKWTTLKILKMQYTTAHLISVLIYVVVLSLLMRMNDEDGIDFRFIDDTDQSFGIRLLSYMSLQDMKMRLKLILTSGLRQLSGVFVMYSLLQYTAGVTNRFRSMQVILHYHDILNKVFTYFPIIACSLALLSYLISFSCLVAFSHFEEPSSALQSLFIWSYLNPFWHLFLTYSLLMGMTLQIYFFIALKKYFESSDFHNRNQQVEQFSSRRILLKLVVMFTLLFIFGVAYVFGIIFKVNGIVAELNIVLGHLTMSLSLFFTEWYLLKVRQLCECMKPITISK